MRVIDFLTDAATRPAILPSEAKKLESKQLDAYPETPATAEKRRRNSRYLHPEAAWQPHFSRSALCQ